MHLAIVLLSGFLTLLTVIHVDGPIAHAEDLVLCPLPSGENARLPLRACEQLLRANESQTKPTIQDVSPSSTDLALRRELLRQHHETILETARIQAAGQALLGIGMSGGLFKAPPPLPPLPLAPTPLFTPVVPFAPPPPVNCTSQQIGGMVSTNCY